MKTSLSTILISCLLALTALSASAADMNQELDALGANRELMKKAKAIDPQNRIRVVQNREVDRDLRFEFGVSAALNAGGDPYVNSNTIGAQVDFHLTPRWSLGARYMSFGNSLSSEGKRVFDEAQRRRAAGDNNYRVPETDYASSSYLATINWYPVYGKLNLFDAAIAQFDLYVLGGAGQINLSSGNTPTYTAGGGIGIWLTQHFSTRMEARWQGYQDRVYEGRRDINMTVLSLSFGLLL